ncbi:IS3 family transposase [Streptomyces sp. MA15]|nr:IS3 family transposase [Streptomyces sp. MA15]MDN3267077.1 IS3 family transposase [Streptomyces sp. MA15]
MNGTYAFIEAERTTHGVALLRRLLNVARSSLYAWQAAAKARAARKAADEALAHGITVLQVASGHPYGVPRIHAEPRRPGRAVDRRRVARVMRERGVRGAHRRRRRSLTRPDKKAGPAPDLIGRDFTPSGRARSRSGTSPASPPPRAGSTSPAGWTWPPARSSDTRQPTTTAPPSPPTP